MAFVKKHQHEQIVIYNGREIPASQITETDVAVHRIISNERVKAQRSRSGAKAKGGRQNQVSQNKAGTRAGTSKKIERGRSRQRQC